MIHLRFLTTTGLPQLERNMQHSAELHAWECAYDGLGKFDLDMCRRAYEARTS